MFVRRRPFSTEASPPDYSATVSSTPNDVTDAHRERKRTPKLNITLSFLATAAAFLVLAIMTSDTEFDSVSSPFRSSQPPPTPPTRRFPQYGTSEFAEMCNWTTTRAPTTVRNEPKPESNPDCTFLVRPLPSSNEGISAWMSEVAATYVYSAQLGHPCRLVLDYGRGVDVRRVLRPVNDEPEKDWTVPGDLERCVPERGCFQVSGPLSDRKLRRIREHMGMIRKNKDGGGKFLLPVPTPVMFFHYRFAYTPYRPMDLKLYRDVESALPGFRYETGMACSLGSVLALSPVASEFVPNLFTTILPTLNDPGSFVIALYIHTGLTDGKENNRVDQNAISCAFRLEEDHVSNGLYSRAVWMVVTDSPGVGRAIVSSYYRRNETALPSGAVIHREVLTTSSRGVQTRPNRDPNTADFAEAVLDWFLIGNSDVVVSGLAGVSFGATAALRTARPYYVGQVDGCYKREIPMGRIKNMSRAYPW